MEQSTSARPETGPSQSTTPITPRQIEPSHTPSSVEFYSVPKEVLGHVWKSVCPLIERSLKYSSGKATLREIHDSLLEEKSQLFIAVDGNRVRLAWITEIEQYKTQKVLCIKFAGGRDIFSFVHDAFSMMERWAREMGCDAIEIYGRPGWERLLKMKRTSVTLRKELGDKQ